MNTLTDASPLLGDRVAQRAALRRDGYLFYRALLPADEVKSVAAELLDVLRAHRWVRAGDPPGRLTLRRWRGAGRDTFRRVYAALQSQESLHRLVGHPHIRSFVESLLGESLLHPQRIIRTTLPVRAGGPETPAVHRDYPTWRVLDMLTIWMPLLACPPERGGLCVLAGSHRRNELPEDLTDPDWATADYQPGDLVLMHCYTAHGALPNRTSLLRLSVDSRWQRRDLPVPAWALLPDGGDDWCRHTAGWSTTAWIDTGTAAVVDDNVAWEPLSRLPASSLLEIAADGRGRQRATGRASDEEDR